MAKILVTSFGIVRIIKLGAAVCSFEAQSESAYDHKHPADLDMVKIYSLWGSPIARRYFDNLA